MIRALALAVGLLTALPVAAMERFLFESIDGGFYDTSTWAGRPILVVNTASLCAFTPQYDALQALHDRYKGRGLIVLAVPSDDFQQELSSEAEVKEFCTLNFGLDLPMTTITDVRGADAHPFYRWLARQHGFSPAWNFNKVLIAPDGQVAATWGSGTRPLSRAIVGSIEAMLNRR